MIQRVNRRRTRADKARIQSDLTDWAETTRVLACPGPSFAPSARRWQGIASIACTPNGRLWVTAYSGGDGEGNDNYAYLATSDDGGQTWIDPVAVIDPPGTVRAWDPCLWLDPHGHLWWTWTQSQPEPGEVWDGRGGVWAMHTPSPEAGSPDWSPPRRLGDGVALNKPIFASNGEWLLPVTVWPDAPGHTDLDALRWPGLLVSQDHGRSWQRRGTVEVDHRLFDEPVLAESQDGQLCMWMRIRGGVSEATSRDFGNSWSTARPSSLGGPGSRIHVSRLASRRLLLINHHGNPPGHRSHLTALLSEDDGSTWPHRLLLDARCKVSYPDAAQSSDGRLWIVYDHNRYAEREILLQTIDEAQILAGDAAHLPTPRVVSKATGPLVPSRNEATMVPGGGFEPPTKGL
ncbi:MAG: sialidase family protein [Opitutales bacterium]